MDLQTPKERKLKDQVGNNLYILAVNIIISLSLSLSTVRPNAFISMRIPSSTVREKFEEIQQKLRDADPSLKSAMVSLKTLHITLMVLRLDSTEQEEK